MKKIDGNYVLSTDNSLAQLYIYEDDMVVYFDNVDLGSFSISLDLSNKNEVIKIDSLSELMSFCLERGFL